MLEHVSPPVEAQNWCSDVKDEESHTCDDDSLVSFRGQRSERIPKSIRKKCQNNSEPAVRAGEKTEGAGLGTAMNITTTDPITGDDGKHHNYNGLLRTFLFPFPRVFRLGRKWMTFLSGWGTLNIVVSWIPMSKALRGEGKANADESWQNLFGEMVGKHTRTKGLFTRRMSIVLVREGWPTLK